jgi:hypothetical protein
LRLNNNYYGVDLKYLYIYMPKSRTKRTSTKRTSTNRTSTKKNSTKKVKEYVHDALTEMIIRIKEYHKNLKKNTKDKSSLIKCHAFIKKDYETMRKRVSKQPGSMSLPKDFMEYGNELSKLTYCNEKCDGFDDTFYGDPKLESKFKNNIKDGFSKIYTSDEIEHLKEQGALSGCKFGMSGLTWSKK